MGTVADLWHGRLLRFVLAAAGLYAIAALGIDTPILILAITGLALSAAAGVCIAYLSVFAGAMLAVHPTKGDFLAAGIWLVSVNVLSRCLLSIVARDLGWPGIFNSNWMTASLAIGTVGALLHLWAPHAVEGRLPPPRWIPTAVVGAIAIGVVFVLWTWHVHAGHPLIELQ